MKHNKQYRRIRRYETKMKQAQRLLEEKPHAEELATLISELDAYYRSDVWKCDFAADEAGKIPANLSRGILSEDGLYNLLESYESKKEA